MKWQYQANTKRLNLYGTDCEKDVKAVKKLVHDKKVPTDLTSIVYRKDKSSTVVMIIRGRFLENLLKIEEVPALHPWDLKSQEARPTPRPGIKAILKQINEANSRQSSYSGLLFYCTETKRFLFFTPKAREESVQLLGDNPMEGETPPDTVCRVSKDDGNFEITPNCLLALTPVDLDGTMYYTYLCLTTQEFQPAVSDRIINSIWKEADKIKELTLHPSVAAVFEKDKKLLKLVHPPDILGELDYDKLIDDILHTE